MIGINLEQRIIKRKNGLKLMYAAAFSFTLLAIIAELMSRHFSPQMLLPGIIGGGYILLMALFTSRFPRFGGIVSMVLSIHPIVLGLYGAISMVFVSIDSFIFFNFLAFLTGGSLMFAGAFTVVWQTYLTEKSTSSQTPHM